MSAAIGRTVADANQWPLAVKLAIAEEERDELQRTKISWQTTLLPYRTDNLPYWYRKNRARHINNLPALHFQVPILSLTILLAILFHNRHRQSFLSLVP